MIKSNKTVAQKARQLTRFFVEKLQLYFKQQPGYNFSWKAVKAVEGKK